MVFLSPKQYNAQHLFVQSKFTGLNQTEQAYKRPGKTNQIQGSRVLKTINAKCIYQAYVCYFLIDEWMNIITNLEQDIHQHPDKSCNSRVNHECHGKHWVRISSHKS